MQGIEFHIPTWVTAAAVVNAALALSLLLALRGQHPALRDSLPVWARGSLLLATGWLLLAFRDLWPALISLLVSNTLIALGMAECVDALRRFRGGPRRRIDADLCVLGVVLMSVLFGLLWPDRLLRISVNTGLVALLFAFGASEAWRAGAMLREGARSHRVVVVVFGFAACVLAVRVAMFLWLGREHMPAVDEINLVQALFYGAGAMGPAVATLGFALMCNDRLALALRRLAEEDALTGVANRRHVERVGRRLGSDGRLQRPLALVLIDIDHFKRVNDAHGHAGGDAVLRRLAALLRDAAAPLHGTVGRIGGEEFVVLLPGHDIAVAERLAESVRVAAAADATDAIGWTLSAGIAEATPADADFEALLRRADDALYAAKRGGRDQVVRAAAPGS